MDISSEPKVREAWIPDGLDDLDAAFADWMVRNLKRYELADWLLEDALHVAFIAGHNNGVARANAIYRGEA